VDSAQECASLVQDTQPTANGATWGPTTRICLAEFGMTGKQNTSNPHWTTCMFESHNPSPSTTEAPTETPTEVPTKTPTEAPTETPTEAPTETPTEAPTVICTFWSGVGSGGHSEYVGQVDSAEECARQVQDTQPTANGVTWGPNNKICLAEIGMTGQERTSSPYWTTCMFESPPAPPVESITHPEAPANDVWLDLGSSETPTKFGLLPDIDGLTCPSFWMHSMYTGHNSAFFLTVTGRVIRATRVDRNWGWTYPLTIRCTKEVSPATALLERRALVAPTPSTPEASSDQDSSPTNAPLEPTPTTKAPPTPATQGGFDSNEVSPSAAPLSETKAEEIIVAA